jgi:hypothetical protein
MIRCIHREQQKQSDETVDTDAKENKHMRPSRRGVLMVISAHRRSMCGGSEKYKTTDAETDTETSIFPLPKTVLISSMSVGFFAANIILYVFRLI